MPLFPLMHEMTTDHIHEEIQLLAIDFSTMFFETLASVPFLVRPDEVEPVPLGELEVSRGGRRVRFTLGAFKRGPQTQISLAERLILDLIDPNGRPIRQLTVRNGARELMPAEYSFTVERNSLPSGRYAFRARAWAPRQDEPTERRSGYFGR